LNCKIKEEVDELNLEPGSREARIYDLFNVGIGWALAAVGVSLAASILLFGWLPEDSLRVSGLAAGIGLVAVFAARLVALRGTSDAQLDEWVAVLATGVGIVALTEVIRLVLQWVGISL